MSAAGHERFRQSSLIKASNSVAVVTLPIFENRFVAVALKPLVCSGFSPLGAASSVDEIPANERKQKREARPLFNRLAGLLIVVEGPLLHGVRFRSIVDFRFFLLVASIQSKIKAFGRGQSVRLAETEKWNLMKEMCKAGITSVNRQMRIDCAFVCRFI